MSNNHKEFSKITKVLKILNKAEIRYIDDSYFENFYKDLWNNLTDYNDSPDCITTFEDNVFPVEHFEIDSFKRRNHKGSKLRTETQSFVRDFISSMKDKETKEITSDFNTVNLINNFNKMFDKHYSNLNTYIKTLQSDEALKNKRIHYPWFLIEVKDPFNSGTNANNEEIEINLIFSDILIEKLEKSKLFGVIVIYYKDDNNYIYFLRNTPYCLSIAKENMIKIKNCKYNISKLSLIGVKYNNELEFTSKLNDIKK